MEVISCKHSITNRQSNRSLLVGQSRNEWKPKYEVTQVAISNRSKVSDTQRRRWTNLQHWAARMSVLTVLVSNYVLFAFALRFTRDFQALFETAFEYCVTLVYWKVVRLFKSKLQCDFCLNSGSGVYAAMFRTRRMQLLRGKQEVLAIQQNMSNFLWERLSRFHGWKQSSGIARTFHWIFMECCSFSVHGNFQFVRMRLEGL